MCFGSYTSKGNNNRAYNNTFHNSGYQSSVSGSADAAVTFFDGVTGNVLKNNLYSVQDKPYGALDNDQVCENEFVDETDGDPMFLNASTELPEDKMDPSLPDFRIPADSPAVDLRRGPRQR